MKSDEQNQTKASSDEETSSAKNENSEEKKQSESSDTASNDGVKILEEVFGKATVAEKTET